MKKFGFPNPAMVSIMVLILATWAVDWLLTLDAMFLSEIYGTHESSTANVPIY